MNKKERIIIHHSAVSRKKNSHQFEAINTYHKKKWNFKSKFGLYIGYAYLIEPDGEIIQGRYENEEGAHCIGQNNSSIGICMTGNFDIEEPTPEQVISITKLIKKLRIKYSLARDDIKYHREYANKTCPGKLITDNFKNMITKMKEVRMDESSGYWFCKQNTNTRQKIDTSNKGVGALITILTRELGVERISNEDLEKLEEVTNNF